MHLLEARLQLCSVGALKIYFAGPLFTSYERSFIDECAAALRADGFEVFVPHEHELATGVDVTAAWIFAKDRPGIERADAMLAILDGPSVDDGTACEIGMFHALMQSDPSKKGIVGLLTDIRGMRGESTASTSSSRARSRTSAGSSPPSTRRATCSEPGDKPGPADRGAHRAVLTGRDRVGWVVITRRSDKNNALAGDTVQRTLDAVSERETGQSVRVA